MPIVLNQPPKGVVTYSYYPPKLHKFGGGAQYNVINVPQYGQKNLNHSYSFNVAANQGNNAVFTLNGQNRNNLKNAHYIKQAAASENKFTLNANMNSAQLIGTNTNNNGNNLKKKLYTIVTKSHRTNNDHFIYGQAGNNLQNGIVKQGSAKSKTLNFGSNVNSINHYPNNVKGYQYQYNIGTPQETNKANVLNIFDDNSNAQVNKKITIVSANDNLNNKKMNDLPSFPAVYSEIADDLQFGQNNNDIAAFVTPEINTNNKVNVIPSIHGLLSKIGIGQNNQQTDAKTSQDGSSIPIAYVDSLIKEFVENYSKNNPERTGLLRMKIDDKLKNSNNIIVAIIQFLKDHVQDQSNPNNEGLKVIIKDLEKTVAPLEPEAEPISNEPQDSPKKESQEETKSEENMKNENNIEGDLNIMDPNQEQESQEVITDQDLANTTLIEETPFDEIEIPLSSTLPEDNVKQPNILFMANNPQKPNIPSINYDIRTEQNNVIQLDNGIFSKPLIVPNKNKNVSDKEVENNFRFGVNLLQPKAVYRPSSIKLKIQNPQLNKPMIREPIFDKVIPLESIQILPEFENTIPQDTNSPTVSINIQKSPKPECKDLSDIADNLSTLLNGRDIKKEKENIKLLFEIIKMFILRHGKDNEPFGNVVNEVGGLLLKINKTLSVSEGYQLGSQLLIYEFKKGGVHKLFNDIKNGREMNLELAIERSKSILNSIRQVLIISKVPESVIRVLLQRTVQRVTSKLELHFIEECKRRTIDFIRKSLSPALNVNIKYIPGII